MRRSAGAWSGKTSEVPGFPLRFQAESVSRNGRSKWDVLSSMFPNEYAVSRGRRFSPQAL